MIHHQLGPGVGDEGRETGPGIEVAVVWVLEEGEVSSMDLVGHVFHGWLELMKELKHSLCKGECTKLYLRAGMCEGAEQDAVWQPGVVRAGLPKACRVLVMRGPFSVGPWLGPLRLLRIGPSPQCLCPLEDLDSALQLQAPVEFHVAELGGHHWHASPRSTLNVDQTPEVRFGDFVALDALALDEASSDQRVDPGAPLLIEPLDG
mmetsp:Transcript_16654/g.35256  ORF Transcript_16654/g.35256 Transcript_16654/m.35256 type:complete len:205 (+) Transcript_16654:735-1349(+)